MHIFDIGDFVSVIVNNKVTHKFKIQNIDALSDYHNPDVKHTVLYDGEWDSYNDEPSYAYADICVQWTPRTGEWCWFWDTDNLQLRKFEKMDLVNPHLFMPFDSVMGFKYCEPFFGNLPTILENLEKEENEIN